MGSGVQFPRTRIGRLAWRALTCRSSRGAPCRATTIDSRAGRPHTLGPAPHGVAPNRGAQVRASVCRRPSFSCSRPFGVGTKRPPTSLVHGSGRRRSSRQQLGSGVCFCLIVTFRATQSKFPHDELRSPHNGRSPDFGPERRGPRNHELNW